MSQEDPSADSLSSNSSNTKKRPRSSPADDLPRPSSTQNLDLTEMSLEQPSAFPNSPIQKLRLEAIFHPKFENEKSTQVIRQEMKQLVEDQLGYLEVSLKHSGSLILWSGGQRYYSKNSLSNQFTLVAEILLRQHFERAWRTSDGQDGALKYEECSRVLEDSRLTCAFEVVTAVLGDHGDIPNRDFLILTAIADRSKERFYSTGQTIEYAQRFRLPHNDAWAFTTTSSCEKLFRLYDESRETGMATDAVAALTQAAEAHVASMYPHVHFQGDILEGFIIRFISYRRQSDSKSVEEQLHRLAANAQEILQQVHPSLPSSFDLKRPADLAVYKANIRSLFEKVGGPQRGLAARDDFTEKIEEVLRASDGDRNRRRVHKISSTGSRIDLPDLTRELTSKDDQETRRISELLQKLSDLNKTVTYSVVREQLPSCEARTLCIVNVMHDETFLQYQKRKNPGAMNLFRGFCVEVVNDNETPFNDGVSSMECDDDNDDGPLLMIKMKLLPYMIRTFICRNQLRTLRQDGSGAFLRASRQLMDRWSISSEGKAKWMPFLEQWAIFAERRLEVSVDGLPPLNSFSYLKHLEHFRHLYERGQTMALETASPNAFRGFVCVVAPTAESSEHAARVVAEAIECQLICSLKDAVGRWTINGVVCFGTVSDLSKQNFEFLASVSGYSVIVMYGCSDEEIDVDLLGKPGNVIKACKGKRRPWANLHCFAKWDLSKASIPRDGAPSSNEFLELLSKIRQSTDANAEEGGSLDWRPGVLVFFPSIPGCGKSSLLESMGAELQKRLADSCDDGKPRNVHVLVGDELGKQFWLRLKANRTKDLSCLMIADKNIPPSAWENIGATCSATRAFPLAVFPDKAALKTTQILGSRKPDGSFDPVKSHFYPFSLEYLAICMARVLLRKPTSHVGRLDSGAPLAAMIVVTFYSFYRYKSAEEFRENIDAKLKSAGALDSLEPVTLPFMVDGCLSLPEDVTTTLTEALQLQVGYDTAKAKVKIEDPAVKEMEERLRKCMIKAGYELLARGTSLKASRDAFRDQVILRVRALSAKKQVDTAGDKASGPKVKLASIDVPWELVHQTIKAQSTTGNISDFLAMALSDHAHNASWDHDHYKGELFVKQTHVTMMFWQRSTQEAIQQAFKPVLGAEVELQARALLWGDGVAALEVSIADATLDGKEVPPCANGFSHITVWVAEDAQARTSNLLPRLVEEGVAQRVEFTAPVPLSGKFSFWDFENNPLPID